MLRIYSLQQYFNLSDPAVEEALYDSASMLQFVSIDLGPSQRRMKPRYVSSDTCWKKTPAGQSDLCRGQRAPEKPGKEPEHGNDRRRQHHHRAELDEEQGPAARPRDASLLPFTSLVILPTLNCSDVS